MAGEAIAEGVASLGSAMALGYEMWNWRRGRLERTSTKAAVILGLIAVIAYLVPALAIDVGPNDPSDGVAFGWGLLAFLGTLSCLGAPPRRRCVPRDSRARAPQARAAPSREHEPTAVGRFRCIDN